MTDSQGEGVKGDVLRRWPMTGLTGKSWLEESPVNPVTRPPQRTGTLQAREIAS